MIKEAHVSFEVSKLLKEKGFDELCRTFYQDKEFVDDVCMQYYQWNSKSLFGQISAPTQQMAMTWLREKGIHMSIDTVISSNGNIYFNIDTYSEDSGWNHPVDFYDSYEQAVEAALKYVLENLI